MASDTEKDEEVQMEQSDIVTDPSKTNKKKATKNENKTKIAKIDKDGFALPSPRDTRRARKVKQTNGVPTSNEFESLSDADSESSTKSSRKRKTPKTLTTQSTLKEASPVLAATKAAKLQRQQNDRESRMKPIRIPKTTFGTIQTVLQALTLTQTPEVSKSFGEAYNIVARTAEDKKKIIDRLIVKGIAHYTHSEPQDRHLVYIVKGHHHVKAEELLKTLTTQEIPAVSVAQIGQSTTNPTYAVTFAKNNITFAELTTRHRIIGGLRITWDKFEPKSKRYAQCKRCQKWGHGATNCNMPRKCVKCLESHEPGECARKSKDDEGQPKCVNCGEEGHPANSTSCSAFKKHIKAINHQKQQQRPRTFSSTPAPWSSQKYARNFPPLNVNLGTSQPVNFPISTNREYRPSLTQPRNDQNKIQTQNEASSPFDWNEEIMGIPGMTETLKLYRELVRQLRENSDKHAQLKVLIKFGLHLE